MSCAPKKIYFSGAIRGGRDYVQTYHEIIHVLKNFSTVLTEHIGNTDLTASGEPFSDSDIYQRDMKWLHDADVFIAEVSSPSLGVGYEIAKAEELRKPIICLYRRDSDSLLSAMIAGNRRITLYRYKDVHDLKNWLESFLKDIR